MDAELKRKAANANVVNLPTERSLAEDLEKIRRDLNDVVGALALLGIRRCSQCKQFLKSDPGTFFDSGELVCYECVPGWWSSMSGQLGIVEREKLEAGLTTWLRRYHAQRW